MKSQKKGRPKRDFPKPDAAGRRSLLVWWLAGVALMLGATPLWSAVVVQALPPPDNSVLSAERAWNPLLSYVDGVSDWATMPYWLYAVAVALLLAAVSVRAVRALHPIVVGIFLVGMCNVNSYGHLFAAASILLAVETRDRWAGVSSTPRDAWRFWGIAALCALVAVSTTLEFSLPLLILSAVVFKNAFNIGRDSGNRVLALALTAAWLALMAAPAFFFTGYAAAALRPLSVLWHRPPQELMPSMTPVWQSEQFGVAHVCVLILIAERWRLAMRSPATTTFYGLDLALFTVIGLASGRYFWLASSAIAMTAAPRQTAPRQAAPSWRFAKLAPAACLAVGLLTVTAQFVLHGRTILAVDMRTRWLDPSAWRVEGPVMLTNLDQCRHWRRSGMQEQYPLVISDRWDVNASLYPEYQAVCNDWKSWRREAYIRRDGGWGGFGRPFDDWRPALVAVDSEDLDAFRSLAFDSHWKVMGLDGSRAIFAHSENPQAEAQLRRARRLLAYLDVPRPAANPDFERAVRLGGAPDARRVSCMLTALRMPFAAMRVLPNDRAVETELAHIWALLEHAYRTQRYTGQPALLETARALPRWRALASETDIPPSFQRRLQQAKNALEAMKVDPQGESGDVERRVRERLLAGDVMKARRLTNSIADDAKVPFYNTLCQAARQPPEATSQALLRSATDARLDARLRDEAWYYLGVLSIEVGDFVAAKDALSRIESSSPFGYLARVYLMQLGPVG